MNGCCDGGGPCQTRGFEFVTVGCCVGLTESLAGQWQGGHRDSALHIAQLSRRTLPLLSVMPSVFLFSFCLCLAFCLLIRCQPVLTRDAAARNLTSCWTGSTRLTIPFTFSALAVCAAYLGCPWTPKEGYLSSSLRVIQKQGCVEESGLLRRLASDLYF